MRQSIFILALLAGCQSNNHFAPATYVSGLRLLTVVAEPPEVAPGQSTTLNAYIEDPQERDLNIHWSLCTAPRPADSGPIADACQTDPTVLSPVGDGAQIPFTMPSPDPAVLGLPDSSFGVYLPIRVDFSASGDGGTDSGSAFYRLRLGLGLQPPNQNPIIDDVLGVALPDVNASLGKQPSPQPFSEATPIEVGTREGVRLQAGIDPQSDETYLVPTSETTTQMVTEQLRAVWYASAGDFNNPVTGLSKPDTTFKLDNYQPSSGSLIDLWVVVTDERGGQAISHRSLLAR
jgi:hypothetical protein